MNLDELASFIEKEIKENKDNKSALFIGSNTENTASVCVAENLYELKYLCCVGLYTVILICWIFLHL